MAFQYIVRATPAEFSGANPILEPNQIGVEMDVRDNANTVPPKAKIGDGSTRWNDLEYWNPGGLAEIPWTPASASAPASLDFAEDTDNGTHAVTLKAPASVTANVDVTLPDAAGTLALTSQYGTPGIKRYVALLTQNATDAPVATVLENTLGGDVTWNYSGVGEYTATSTVLFTADKTLVFVQGGKASTGGGGIPIIGCRQYDASTIIMGVVNDAGVFTDVLLEQASVAIYVYP